MTDESDRTAAVRVDWDAAAATFDDEPDHGLRAPEVRAAWAARLRAWLPGHPADVLDLGCGTGSLALLAAEQGHRVTGVDLSPAMVERARAKTAGRDVAFLLGDAAAPPVGERRFDAVLVRHLLWTLPEPARALRHWAGLLRPGGGPGAASRASGSAQGHALDTGGGRLVLVEGVWGTSSPVGIPAGRLTALLEPIASQVRVEPLSDDPVLWGGPVTDERYAVVATV
ncbi:class I SAM-dependent methyltransferase [Streptomyces sp. NPDC002514]|uniref:class I SAM-dependent methyltransferase n=1 Tax=Streptomyces sp. NPDC001270 TaxID=3364554 RepID=UPI0036C53B5A